MKWLICPFILHSYHLAIVIAFRHTLFGLSSLRSVVNTLNKQTPTSVQRSIPYSFSTIISSTQQRKVTNLFSSYSPNEGNNDLETYSYVESTRSPNNETYYITCESCRSTYIVDRDFVSPSGKRVRCGVCSREWKQHLNNLKVLNTSVMHYFPAQRAESGPKTIINKYGLFIRNLAPTVDEDYLASLFQDYGIGRVSIPKDSTGCSKCFGFITMYSNESTDMAITEMNGKIVHNRKLHVMLQKENPKTQ